MKQPDWFVYFLNNVRISILDQGLFSSWLGISLKVIEAGAHLYSTVVKPGIETPRL